MNPGAPGPGPPPPPHYLGMLGVGAPQIGTRPRAEVGLVALGLVDPPPAQVLLKVDVERAQAAVVLDVSRGRQDGREDDLLTGEGQEVPLVPRKTDEQTDEHR